MAKCRADLDKFADLQSVNPVVAIFALELVFFSLKRFILMYGGVVPLPVVQHTVGGVVAGVEHLHRQLFIHRDLEPDNILLRVDGPTGSLIPKIADLGSSVAAERAMTRGVCTAYYRAPELFEDQAISVAAGQASSVAATRYGGEVDVWSCGVVAAEMLLGKHPWSFSSDDWPTAFAAIAAKLGRPTGAKALCVGKVAQDMVAGGMWKDVAGARRHLADIPAQAENLVNKMTKWRHADRCSMAEANSHAWFRTAPAKPGQKGVGADGAPPAAAVVECAGASAAAAKAECAGSDAKGAADAASPQALAVVECAVASAAAAMADCAVVTTPPAAAAVSSVETLSPTPVSQGANLFQCKCSGRCPTHSK